MPKEGSFVFPFCAGDDVFFMNDALETLSLHGSICTVERTSLTVRVYIGVLTRIPRHTLRNTTYSQRQTQPATGMSGCSPLQQMHRGMEGTGAVGGECWQAL